MIVFSVLSNLVPVVMLLMLIESMIGLYIGVFPFWFIFLFFCLLSVISYYKIWRKMGKPTWQYFFPIFTDLEMLDTLGENGWILSLYPLFLLGSFFIKWIPYGAFKAVVTLCVLGLFVCSMVKFAKIRVALARGFGKGIGFAIGLFFLPFIFVPMLAFGKEKWIRKKEEKEEVREENYEKKVIGGLEKEQAYVEEGEMPEQDDSIASIQVVGNAEKDKSSHQDMMNCVEHVSGRKRGKVSFSKKKGFLWGGIVFLLLCLLGAGGCAWREWQMDLDNKGTTSADCFKYEKVSREGREGVQILSYDVKKCGTDPVIPRYIERKQVVRIGESVFSNNQITSVSFPKGLEEIGLFAFSNNQITSVSFSEGLKKIGIGAFSDNQITSVSFPEGLKEMGDFAFSNNQITSVSLPKGLEEIWSLAFRNNQITSVSFPEGLKKIGMGAFGDNQITSVSFPKGLEEIGLFAFSNNQITFISFPEGLKKIGIGAFRNNQITSVSFPEGLEEVGADAFGENPITSRIVK